MNFEVISDCQEKHLKTFVRELQIVQHLKNQLVQHYKKVHIITSIKKRSKMARQSQKMWILKDFALNQKSIYALWLN
jgi:hypothetical protein